MPFAAAIGAAGTIAGAAISASAGGSQQSAVNSANSGIAGAAATEEGNLLPFMQGGFAAFPTLQALTGTNPLYSPDTPQTAPLTRQFTAADFTSSPGYSFQLQQGLNAILNNASALGGVGGGNTLKALQTYGTGLANQDYYNAQNAFTNWQNNTFNKILGISQLGENAGALSGSAGLSAANAIGNNTIGAGNASAAQSTALGNSISSLLNSNNIQNLFGSLGGLFGTGGGFTNTGFTGDSAFANAGF